MVTLRLLGGISLIKPSGEEISSLLAQPKRMALLTFLALRGRDGYVRRDVLMARFWAESDLSRARNSLNQSLHVLRTDLGEGVLRTRGKDEVGLDPALFDCDVWRFRDALRKGNGEEGLELYRGPLMPGFHVNGGGEFDRWLEEEREALRKAAAGAAWTVARQRIRRGQLMQAEEVARRALSLVCTDETQVQSFISALAGAGDRAAAIRFYEQFCERLLDDLELEPSPATREIAEAIRTGDWEVREESAEIQEAGFREVPGEPAGIQEPGFGRGQRDAVAIQASDPGEPGSEEASPSRPRQWRWAVALAVVIPVFAFLGTRQSPARLGPPPPDRPSAVLADVEGTAEEGERSAVGFLLRTGLDMSHVLQTVPQPDLDRTLGLMERSDQGHLDPATARQLGVRLGAATLIIPRLDRMGDAYSLALRLEDAETGTLQSAAHGQTGSVTGVVELVDSAVLDLREQLGEPEEILRNREPLPQVLTGSLEALREFQLAQKAGAGRARTAVRHLRNAVTADTAFAMAWQLMASFYGNYLNQPDSAELAAEQVGRFPDRLTEARKRDLQLHRRMKSDVALWDLALDDAEEAVLRNPRFLNNYGNYVAAPGGLPDSALNIRFRLEAGGAGHARRFDPELPYEHRCFINTHYMAAALDRMDEFYALLDSVDMALPPDCGREVALFESLAAGEWNRADSLVQHSPGDWRWPTGVETALLQMVPLRGRIRAALVLPTLNRPETRGLRPDSSGFLDIAHLLLEMAYGLPAEEAPEETFESRGKPRALEGRGRFEVTDYVLYGVRESLLGDTVEARRVDRRLQAMRDSATSRTFEGAFEPWFTLLDVGPAVQREDWPAVLETLAPMEKRIHEPKVGSLPGDDYLIWWLMAEAHIHLGDLQDGIHDLESILERPRFRRENWMIQGYIRPAARFKLAGLYAETGNTDKAREHYRIFLDTFTNPEPEFQWMVEEARAFVADPATSSNP